MKSIKTKLIITPLSTSKLKSNAINYEMKLKTKPKVKTNTHTSINEAILMPIYHCNRRNKNKLILQAILDLL